MARCRRVVALALALVVVLGVLGPVQPVQADPPFKDPVWLMETLDSLGYPAYHNLGSADVSLDGGRYLSEGHLYDHVYRNAATGATNYTIDYKVVFGGG